MMRVLASAADGEEMQEKVDLVGIMKASDGKSGALAVLTVSDAGA